MQNDLDEIVRMQKSGQPRGIPSICSAHPWALKAAMQNALRTGQPLLIEATCNQVNQFGGYTGMTPSDFVGFVRGMAVENGLPFEQLMLGGDHLGPNVWENETAEDAMSKSSDLVKAYVQAGFAKIHLDASMRLADDPRGHLPVETVATRNARLAKAAEAAYEKGSPSLRYAIGSEVPIPGGAQVNEQKVDVTSVESAKETLEAHRTAFKAEGLEQAWGRVIALVVQPGVEFGNDYVVDYKSEAACELSHFIEGEPRLIYEIHSTDYQTRENLRNLVCGHFAILKVGPALTFAFREAVFALAMMENELFPLEERSNIIEIIEQAMQHNPSHWQKYYRGSLHEQSLARRFSLSDRLRYYWPVAEVQHALERLLKNLSNLTLPSGLLHQYFPAECEPIRSNTMEISPEAIIISRITALLANYDFACGRTCP